MIKTFAARSEMCGWEHVPARALSADLITRHGESTTYKVVARYEYDYQGRRYVGDRVGIDATGSDNIGTWHQDMHSRLRGAQGREGFMVWVNPCISGRGAPTPNLATFLVGGTKVKKWKGQGSAS